MKNQNNKPSSPLLHELFIVQSQKQPKAIAVKSPSKQLTYEELALFSKNLATKLVEKNAQPNQLIVVIMEKGWEQVVATMGILMSGSAYLPIDPSESNERLNYLLSVSEATIVLTQSKYLSRFNCLINKTIFAVDTLELGDDFQDNISLPNLATPSDLAYVIFTSGSTGTPKGVMITHHAVMNTILDVNERFSVGSRDSVFALSNLTFDLSVYDIFGTLSAGGTIVLPDAEHVKDPTQWLDVLRSTNISIWNSAPALMNVFTDYLSHKNTILFPRSLRLILLSGDWIPLNLPRKIRALFGNIEVISLGGATEASIWSILYPIHAIDPSWRSIPYGKPMKNQYFHVLDEKQLPVNSGESGELFIGGEGVAAGYWRDPDRTKAQFVQHPTYGRLYKTGDLGRYLPDGNIEFLGRVDFQTKVAGYRVEINAIEKYLLDFPFIEHAIVSATQEKGHQQLIAYVKFDEKKIRQRKYFDLMRRVHVNQWKKIYNYLSKEECSIKKNDSTFNTIGWVSSYLNKSIPAIQMEEWVNNTVKRIQSLKPQSILEIGCGTGLLLFPLAKHVQQYDATDLSKNTIRRIKMQLMKHGINNTKIIECEATKINYINSTYDTVILNSVVQYFPDVDYFMEVLTKSIEKIQGKGQVFIGDLRSLHLLNAFHTSLFINKMDDYSDYTDWKNNIEYSLKEEDELLIDFNLFYILKENNSRISHIEILLKEGKFQNEMNCFRYDVIVYVDHPVIRTDNKLVWLDWDKSRDNCFNLEIIKAVLKQNTPYVLAVRDIPNKRTAGLNVELASSEGKQWVNLYNTYYVEAKKAAVDPNVIYSLAKDHNYYASATWSANNPSECFNVLLMHNNICSFAKEEYLNLFYENNKNVSLQSWDDYANCPMLPHIKRNLIVEVKKFLQAKLPHYMIPSYFMPIEELALSPNGKIDRNHLPKLYRSATTKHKLIHRPETALQKQLVAVWQRILGMQHIDINDHFHELGGTSLLSIELMTVIERELGVTVTYKEMNACTINIKNLSKLIEKRTKNSSHSRWVKSRRL